MRRRLHLILPLVGLALFAISIALPTAALVIRSAAPGKPTASQYAMTVRQWTLLGSTLTLAGAATLVTIVISLPAAYVMSCWGGDPRRRGLLVLLALPLLLPPMVLVFGWQKLLGWSSINLDATRRWCMCVLLWAAWAWPIPALVLGAAWRRLGRSAFESAVLDTTPSRAFLRVVQNSLAGYVGACGAVLFALFCGEYTVPHACGLIVYATELLGWAGTAQHTIEVVAPALPMVAIIAAATAIATWLLIRRPIWSTPDPGTRAAVTHGGRLTATVALLLIVTVAVPIAALCIRLFALPHRAAAREVVGPMTLAWVTYRGALLDSGIVAAVAGIAAVLLGAGIVTWRRRASASVWAVLFGVLPGALIGESILAAYRPIDWIYSGWPIVVIGYVARYGWVGVLAAWLAVQASGRDLAEQARSDGAGELAITTRIRLAASMPILLCGAAIVAALSLSDIATASLVQVPSLPLISLILLDKYHRFEDGMLICLSLWLVAAALPGAILLAVTRSAQGALRN